MHKPYTYYIAWPEHNLHYYGVRFAKDCSPNDLWVSYFTSSKKVKTIREIYGEPSIIEVRKIFESTNAARLWEARVIKRLKAPSKKNWLNMSDHNDKFYHEGARGAFTDEHRKKLSDAAKKRKLTLEHKAKLNAGRRNSKNSPEHAAAIIASRVGSKHSSEAKVKMSIAAKARWGRKRLIL